MVLPGEEVHLLISKAEENIKDIRATMSPTTMEVEASLRMISQVAHSEEDMEEVEEELEEVSTLDSHQGQVIIG